MNVPYAGNRIARFHEKRGLWYGWLGYWGYSTLDVYRRLLGYRNSPAHARWLRTECERGFMSGTRGLLGYPNLTVYTATPLAAAHGLLGPGDAMAASDCARFLGRPAAAHDLAVQHYVAPIATARPCSAMDVNGIQHQPDAITDDRVCYEIELTQKSDSRIYRFFLFYAYAISDGTVREVHFVFRSPAIADAYQRRFAETEWPDALYDAHRRRYVAREPYTVDADHPIRAAFHFHVESHLWPFPPN